MALQLIVANGISSETESFMFLMFQERHWTSPAMAATLQAVINTPQSDRLKQALRITPRLLDVYFAIAIHDVNDCMFWLFQ